MSRHLPKIAAGGGSREFQFYVSNAAEINRRYAGKHVAIIGDRVVASGESPLEVYRRAKKSHPHGRPLLAYVPTGETLVLVEECVGGVSNGQDSYPSKGLEC